MSDLTAILLCGGKGERLRPFTDMLPKALVPLNGRPLLHHLLTYLSRSGIYRFVVCLGYKAEAIEEFLADHREPAWDVVCVNSGDVSMTDRILDAQKHVYGKALVCYGDTLANVNLVALKKKHQSSDALATLTVYPLHSPFGIVSFDASNRISDFAEKPCLPYWINIGFILCELGAFDYIKRGSDMPVFLSKLAEAGVLFAYQHRGKHLTVNTEKERAVAENQIIQFYTNMNSEVIIA